MYDYGFEGNRDYSKAMEYYLKSANQGNVKAKVSIGILFCFFSLIIDLHLLFNRLFVSKWVWGKTGLSKSS